MESTAAYYRAPLMEMNIGIAGPGAAAGRKPV